MVATPYHLLIHQVVIRRAANTVTNGSVSIAYTDSSPVSARVHTSPGEGTADGAVRGNATWKVFLPPGTQVDSDDLIAWEGRAARVLGPAMDMGAQGAMLKVMCAEVEGVL
jgi:hypothetical protein